jgi:hypothetical protein
MDPNKSISRCWLGAAFITALWLAHAPAAQASGGGPTLSEDFMPGLMLTSTAITFGIIDVLYIAHERPMPIALAVLQIAIAGMLTPVAAMKDGGSEMALYAGISSVWFTGHGIYSFAAWSMRERERQRAIAAERERLAACAVDPARRSLLCWPHR